MIVADVNLVAALLLGGADAPSATAVLRRDADWAAPALWRSEFRSILAAYIRRRGLSLDHAVEMFAHAERLLTPRELLPDAAVVLRLVRRSPCSAYDCEYVAAAERLRVPLITLDREVLRHFPAIALRPDQWLAGAGPVP